MPWCNEFSSDGINKSFVFSEVESGVCNRSRVCKTNCEKKKLQGIVQEARDDAVSDSDRKVSGEAAHVKRVVRGLLYGGRWPI